MSLVETQLDPKPKRGGKRRTRVGVFSRAAAVRNLDGRRVEARLLRTTTAELVEQLGGPGRVSAAQRLLIGTTAMIALRLRCAVERYASGDPAEVVESLDRHVCALTNSLRHNLVALGLERVDQQPRSLATYLEARKAAT